jgi:hypothetical protein
LKEKLQSSLAETAA